MFYVIKIELRDFGTIEVLNNNKPFVFLETAQMYCNEIYQENSRDMCEYIKISILHKSEWDKKEGYKIELI